MDAPAILPLVQAYWLLRSALQARPPDTPAALEVERLARDLAVVVDERSRHPQVRRLVELSTSTYCANTYDACPP